MATKTVYLQHEFQHERWGQQAWHKLHQQAQGHKPRYAQAAPVSTARRARSLRLSCPDVVSYTPHWLKLSLSLHSIPSSHMCGSLWPHLPPFLLQHVLLPSSSTPLSWCTLSRTPTSTTWTPCKTCATPQRGVTTPTTSPSPSQKESQWTDSWKNGTTCCYS